MLLGVLFGLGSDVDDTLFSCFDALLYYLDLSFSSVQVSYFILNDSIHHTKLQLLNGFDVPYLVVQRHIILLPGRLQLLVDGFR